MIIGQTVFSGSYLSPWFPRQGDSAVFATELLAAGGGTIVTTVLTKNREDPDTGTLNLGSTNSMTTAGVGTVLGTGLRELVRFSYAVAGSSTNWVHFRVLPPAWRMNGA